VYLLSNVCFPNHKQIFILEIYTGPQHSCNEVIAVVGSGSQQCY